MHGVISSKDRLLTEDTFDAAACDGGGSNVVIICVDLTSDFLRGVRCLQSLIVSNESTVVCYHFKHGVAIPKSDVLSAEERIMNNEDGGRIVPVLNTLGARWYTPHAVQN